MEDSHHYVPSNFADTRRVSRGLKRRASPSRIESQPCGLGSCCLKSETALHNEDTRNSKRAMTTVVQSLIRNRVAKITSSRN